MPGLNLSGALNGGATYTPMTPAAASSPTAATNSQLAFGINQDTAGGGSAAAGIGSVSVGAISLVVLVFLWYSLPR